MVKIQDTLAYKTLWSEAQDWISSNLRKILEKDIVDEDLANRFVSVSAAAYYTNVEDFSPSTCDSLGLRGLKPSRQLGNLLSRIKAVDTHGYASKAIKQYYREARKAN